MQYDPIKQKLGSLFASSTFSRRLFYLLLDILLLRSWHVRRLLRETAPSLPAGARVLDAGAGFGQYSWRMAVRQREWQIEALDLKEEQVRDNNEFFTRMGMGHRVIFSSGDLVTLGREAAYDLILCVDVMEHIEEDELVMANFAGALKEGGQLILSTPSDKGGSDAHGHDGRSFIDEHVRDGYNIDGLSDSLRRAGFSAVDARYTYGPPGSLAWLLSMKYPISMLNLSSLFWLLLPFYYLLLMLPVAALNLADLLLRHREGTGLIVKAIK